jgi:hypothetical protein
LIQKATKRYLIGKKRDLEFDCNAPLFIQRHDARYQFVFGSDSMLRREERAEGVGMVKAINLAANSYCVITGIDYARYVPDFFAVVSTLTV